MLNVLIVDDEPLALDVLETYISQMSELNLVKRCSNALEANEALQAHSIDLMFLDIQMPQLTGIDFVKQEWCCDTVLFLAIQLTIFRKGGKGDIGSVQRDL